MAFSNTHTNCQSMIEVSCIFSFLSLPPFHFNTCNWELNAAKPSNICCPSKPQYSNGRDSRRNRERKGEIDTASKITGLVQEAPLFLSTTFHFNTSACLIGGYLSLKSSPQQHYITINNLVYLSDSPYLHISAYLHFKTCPTSSPHLRWRSPGCRDTYLTERKSLKQSWILGPCRGFCPVSCAAKSQGRGRGRNRVLANS